MTVRAPDSPQASILSAHDQELDFCYVSTSDMGSQEMLWNKTRRN